MAQTFGALVKWVLPFVGMFHLGVQVAHAERVRFALVIGNNRGLSDEVGLQYAERDAERIAQVLRELGEFHEENLVVLKGRRSSDVQRALLDLQQRVQRQVSLGHQVTFVVYYSGHADSQSLHLSGTELTQREFRHAFTAAPAQSRVMIVDACRSGNATRLKGARTQARFAITLVDELKSEGFAAITSSTAYEDSQESDALKGSFFTHYLLSGLRGAADRNGDRRVSLTEVYDYAYAQTLRATSRTLSGPQHPTYDYALSGSGDLILTKVDAANGHGVLGFPWSGNFLVMRDHAEGAVAAELNSDAPHRILLLPAGKYFIRYRGKDYLMEGEVKVSAGTTTWVDGGRFRKVAYAQMVRKGLHTQALSYGPAGLVGLHGPLSANMSPTWLLELDFALETRLLSVTPRVSWGWGSAANPTLSFKQYEVLLGVGVSKVFDFDFFAPFVGVVAGGGLILQDFDSTGRAPNRHIGFALAGIEVGANLELGQQLYGVLRGAGSSYFLRHGNRDSSMDARVTYQITAGIGLHLH